MLQGHSPASRRETFAAAGGLPSGSSRRLMTRANSHPPSRTIEPHSWSWFRSWSPRVDSRYCKKKKKVHPVDCNSPSTPGRGYVKSPLFVWTNNKTTLPIFDVVPRIRLPFHSLFYQISDPLADHVCFFYSPVSLWQLSSGFLCHIQISTSTTNLLILRHLLHICVKRWVNNSKAMNKDITYSRLKNSGRKSMILFNKNIN